MGCIKISTITSCFKAEKYLPTFLEQLPRQTMFDSLQVVLDHSEPTESEIRLVEDFLKKYPGRIKHIIRKEVVPIYVAWNNCVAESDGEFLAVWNIDDLRTPDSLERQYEALQNSDAGVAYGDLYIVRKFGMQDGHFDSRADIPHSQHFRTMRAGPFFMFRKSLCAVAGYFDEQLKVCADFDFCARLAFHTEFVYVPAILGYYLDERLGASTRPDSLQPVEDVFIGLRYGIYDTLNYSLLPNASMYTIPKILNYGEWRSVAQVVPDWEIFLQGCGDTLVRMGVGSFYKEMIFKTLANQFREIVRGISGEKYYNFVKRVWHKIRAI